MKSHIPIDASQHQVTVDPRAGKRQRIVFDLRVLYPTPEIPGSELSFEEVLLARAGWLDERPETPPTVESKIPIRDGNQQSSPVAPEVDLLHEDAPQKLMIHRDTIVPLDENGALLKSTPKEGRPRNLGENAPQKLMIHRDTTVPLDENGSLMRQPPKEGSTGNLGEDAPQKLMIHRDATIPLDENGAPMKPISKEGRPRKKKVTEVNETQISKSIFYLTKIFKFSQILQSRRSWTRHHDQSCSREKEPLSQR